MATIPSVRLVVTFHDRPDCVVTHGPCENEIMNRIGEVMDEWTAIEVNSILDARWEYWEWTSERKGFWGSPSPLQGFEIRTIKRRWRTRNQVVESMRSAS